MEHGCIPIRRMSAAFTVPSPQAGPLSQADRDELYSHFEQREAKRRKEAARNVQAYWDRQQRALCPTSTK